MIDFAKEFTKMIDTYMSYPEQWDDELDIKLLEQEIHFKKHPLMKFPPRGIHYFSPSSVSSDKKELFLKLRKAKKDARTHLPYQRRWTGMGTAFGTYLQHQLAFIEKKYKKLTGEEPAFIVEKTSTGHYAWEDATKTLANIKYEGVDINLFGSVDGILIHKESGTRIGIEIKSKQTSAAKTSEFSMRNPEESHRLQSIAYALMHNLDHYLVVYGNLSKKNWKMSDEEYQKNPDLRVFYVPITEGDKIALLDRLREIVIAADTNTPPKMDINKWNFNNFKQATAQSLTDEEFDEVKDYVKKFIKSGLPQYQKDQVFEAFQELKELRMGAK